VPGESKSHVILGGPRCVLAGEMGYEAWALSPGRRRPDQGRRWPRRPVPRGSRRRCPRILPSVACRPLRVRPAPVDVEHRVDWFEVDTGVPRLPASMRAEGARRRRRSRRNGGCRHSRASGCLWSPLQDADPLHGAHCLGRTAERLDAITEHEGNLDHLRHRKRWGLLWRCPRAPCAEGADRDVHRHAQAWVLGVLADLVDVQAAEVEGRGSTWTGDAAPGAVGTGTLIRGL
jgi:hypothetical protein